MNPETTTPDINISKTLDISNLFEKKYNTQNILDELCAVSFPHFCKNILGIKVSKKHEEAIDLIIQSLESPPEKKESLGIQFSRGHGKTTIFSVALSLWLCWKTPADKPLAISLRSHSQSFSTSINRKLKDYIEFNPKLKERLLPTDFKSNSWSADYIRTKNGHDIFSLPFRQRGNHVDLSICDDIQTDEDAFSTLSLSRIKEAFWGTVYPTTQSKKGIHVVVGTPIAFNDIFYDLSKNKGFHSIKYPAVKIDKDGKFYDPLFPELFSLEQYYHIRNTIPSWAWQREYLLNPIGGEIALFGEDLVKSCIYEDDEEADIPEDIKEYREVFLGCDIAVSEREGSDYSCFIILEKYPDKPLKMIGKWYEKGITTDEQIEKIKELNRINSFSRIVIEQKGISWPMAQKAAEDPEIGYAVERFDTNQKNKEKIVGTLELLMRSKMLKIPYDDSLISELQTFGKIERNGKQTFEAMAGHDDQVIALCLACYAAGVWTDVENVDSTIEAV
uniref:Putative terminase n=1 Tax=viral metagenome TaxID=1070528 RepID=A0A6M3L8W8_9ZZZZ